MNHTQQQSDKNNFYSKNYLFYYSRNSFYNKLQLQQQKSYTNNCWNNKDFTTTVPKITDATIETHATTTVPKTTDVTIETHATTTVPKTTDVTRKVTTKHMSQ
jgi:hypothetical protein